MAAESVHSDTDFMNAVAIISLQNSLNVRLKLGALDACNPSHTAPAANGTIKPAISHVRAFQ
jgi:hypothetical protein